MSSDGSDWLSASLLFINLLWKWQTSFTLSLFNSHGVDVTIHCSWGGFFKTICSQCRFSVWTDFNSWLKTIITCCSGVNVSLTGWHTSAAAQSLCALLSFIHTNITSDICYTIGWNKMRRECCTIRLPRPFPIRPTNMKGHCCSASESVVGIENSSDSTSAAVATSRLLAV